MDRIVNCEINHFLIVLPTLFQEDFENVDMHTFLCKPVYCLV